MLGSASADFTVGVWDLSEGKIVTSIKNHKEKVILTSCCELALKHQPTVQQMKNVVISFFIFGSK